MGLADFIANPGLQLFGLLVATLVLSYAANYYLSRIFYGKAYRYVIAPGVIVHEYAHALGCVLTGARIREIRLFEERGGRVVHEESRLALGEGIISVAPIFGASLAVWLLARALVPSFVGFGDLEISSWQFLVFAYLAASITAAMAPSVQDLKAGIVSYAALCLFIGLASLSDNLSSYFAFLGGDVYEGVLKVVQFALVVLGLLAASSAAVYFILHRTSRKGVRYEPLD